VKAVLESVGVPLIVWGCDVREKDAVVLPKCASAASGENCLFGTAKEKNYRTLVAACLADKHKLICESPLDINIAKQVNILVSDVGYPVKDVVIYPTTGALGYGLEYCYSIMERERLAALGGDKLLQQPVLCSVGYEAWRAKECKGLDEELPGMGLASERGPIWEAVTATNLLEAGADVLVMRHPKAVEIVKKTIERMWGNKG
jgi:acetyl-CoA decarbonylase/synthase complex subunit delta